MRHARTFRFSSVAEAEADAARWRSAGAVASVTTFGIYTAHPEITVRVVTPDITPAEALANHIDARRAALHADIDAAYDEAIAEDDARDFDDVTMWHRGVATCKQAAKQGFPF